MIYLIAKIFLYMFLALGLGFGAGWLSRNIIGAKREDELQKSVTESRSRVPQFESLMRSRDEQVRKLREELTGKDKRIAELSADLQGKDSEIRRAQQEASKLATRNEALENLDEHDAGDNALGSNLDDAPMGTVGSADAVAELEAELRSVKQQLADGHGLPWWTPHYMHGSSYGLNHSQGLYLLPSLLFSLVLGLHLKRKRMFLGMRKV